MKCRFCKSKEFSNFLDLGKTPLSNSFLKKTELNKKEIEALLPHREPMLLIDKLTKIIHLKEFPIF